MTRPAPAPALRPSPALFVSLVYWSTPLFVAVDFLYGVSLRVPFLDALPGAKTIYYAADLACGVAIALRPRWTAVIGLGESVVNIALLILSTGAAYLGMLESAASPDVVIANPFTPQAVTSLAISAAVLAASYTARTATQPFFSSSSAATARQSRSASREASGGIDRASVGRRRSSS